MHALTLSHLPLSRSDLKLVKENFQNIYPTFYGDAVQESLLAPALWGNHVYHAKAGWRGRCLSVIYSIITFFAGGNFKQNRLHATILKTHQVYSDLEKQLSFHLNNYNSYLILKCEKDLSSEEKKIDLARKEIVRFYEATSPYTHLFRKTNGNKWRFKTAIQTDRENHTIERIRAFADTYLSESNEKESAPFFNEELLKKLYDFHHVIALEGQLEEPLPILSLKKLSLWGHQPDGGNEMDQDLQKFQHGWCPKLNYLGKKIDVRNFHKALGAVVDVVRKNYSSEYFPAPSVSKISMAMNYMGFEGYHLADTKHTAWRKTLKEGDVFNYVKDGRRKKRFLGKQLSGKSEGLDKHLIFEVKNKEGEIDPKVVLKIGLNRADLEIRQIEREETKFTISTAEMTYLDPLGRFALMEKLTRPINQIEWKTANRETATRLEKASDFETAKPFMEWIKWCVNQEQSPSNLDVRYLMFNDQGEMKTIKGSSGEEFNVMALENLAYEYANGSLLVYNHIIEPLKNHRRCNHFKRFFEDVIENALTSYRGAALSVSKLGALRGVTDKGVISSSEQLNKDVLRLKVICKARIEAQYRVIDTPSFETILHKEFFRLYREYNTFGRIWDSFTPELLQAAIEAKAARILERKG